jgi:ATP dependent DNA ligase domain
MVVSFRGVGSLADRGPQVGQQHAQRDGERDREEGDDRGDNVAHLRSHPAQHVGATLTCPSRRASSRSVVNGDDLRREPLDVRKATLPSVLAKAAPGLRLNEHIEADGPTVFAHACKMGLEGIVSKRKDSPYRSGRSPDWLKSKNPACEAVRRKAEEDWG